MPRDDSFDRCVRRVLGEPQADELVDAAATATGTRRQIAIARVRAMRAYLAEIDDELSHPPVRALPDEEPLYRLNEVDRLWDRFYEICCPEPETTASVVELLDIVDDVAAKIAEQEHQLAQLQEEMRTGVLAPALLKTLEESLGGLLRDKLNNREFKTPAMSEAELGEVVLLWRRQRGDRNAKGNKWEAAFRLVREAGFDDVQSPQALKMGWLRHRIPGEEIASRCSDTSGTRNSATSNSSVISFHAGSSLSSGGRLAWQEELHSRPISCGRFA